MSGFFDSIKGGSASEMAAKMSAGNAQISAAQHSILNPSTDHLFDSLRMSQAGQSATMASTRFEEMQIQVNVIAFIAGGKKLVDHLTLVKHGDGHSVVHIPSSELVAFNLPSAHFTPEQVVDFMAWCGVLK